MKKKIILIMLSVFVLIFIFGLLLCRKDFYTINVEQVDSFSPDRKLIVYKNDKKIKFKELQYIDGTYLCSGNNSTVSYSEIIGVTELIVIIDEKNEEIAKIVDK